MRCLWRATNYLWRDFCTFKKVSSDITFTICNKKQKTTQNGKAHPRPQTCIIFIIVVIIIIIIITIIVDIIIIVIIIMTIVSFLRKPPPAIQV